MAGIVIVATAGTGRAAAAWIATTVRCGEVTPDANADRRVR